jgi:glycerone phosphate O-acyltransferase
MLDFKAMIFFGNVLRKCGAFFIHRTFGSDPLYWSLFIEYVQSILCNGEAPVEFFIEGTRSRSCKSLHPKMGLFSAVCETYVKRRVSDISILPVSICYEARVEEGLLVWELLGVPKPRELTSGLWKARKVLHDTFGRIHMTFGKMISLHEEIGHTVNWQHHNNRPQFASEKVDLSPGEEFAARLLAYNIIDKQQKGWVLCPSSLVSTVLLQQNTIKKDVLAEKVGKLKEILENRGAQIVWEG